MANDVLVGRDSTTDGNVAIKASANAIHVRNVAEQQGEDSAFDMVWGGNRCKPTSLTADGQIGSAAACYYLGYLVTTTLGAGVINIRDATAAGTGTIVDIVAASATAGTIHMFEAPVYCATGAYADFASTGTVTFFYWQG